MLRYGNAINKGFKSRHMKSKLADIVGAGSGHWMPLFAY
jgi:hypothetical protein